MKTIPRALLPVTLAVAAALMTACSGSDPASMVASAKEYLAKDETKAAIIELKTALQKDPESGEARFLLGQALLASGDAVGASVELRKALELGYKGDEVMPVLASSMVVTGQLKQLTEEFGGTVLTDPQAQAALKVTLARAYGGLRQNDRAEAAARAALQQVPDYGPAKLFLARVQADSGDIDGALKAVEKEIAARPKDAEAWQIKGDFLLAGKRDTEAALAAYRESIAAKPNNIAAHSGAMTILLGRQDLDAAKSQLSQLEKVLPGHPQTHYFVASVALLAKDFDKARSIAQQLLRVAPDNPRILQLAGAAEFEKGSYIVAESHLAKALQLAPGLEVARRLLTLSYLRTSQPARALGTIQPLLEVANPSAATYALAAQAYLQAGDLAEAEKAFAQAAKLNPDDTRSKTALAIGQVLRGDTDGGLAALQSLASDDKGVTADLPLISTLVRKKDYAGALKAIDALERKLPDKPVAANLRARVLLAQGDRAAAIKAFEQALKIQPSFYPAADALARLALEDKRPDEAKRIMDAVLKADPKNTQALLASAGLRARAGAPPDEIKAMFQAAIQKVPLDAGLRLTLINFSLANNDRPGALEAARQAVAALPDDSSLVDALGRAQMASGDSNQALTSFNKLVQLTPASPVGHLRLAQAHLAAKNPDEATQSLKRALAIAPDSLEAQRGLADIHLAAGKLDDAVAVARTIQKQRPKQDTGYLLEGGIEASRKRWDQSLVIYRSGLKATGGTTDLATRTHVALLALKKNADADTHAQDWLKAHPADARFRFYLGDIALAKRELGVAEARYREVLKLEPENALALNNVAWLMAAAKKPGAVAMAEKANELLPNRPLIMDTLASALAAEGQPAKGVDVMRRAMGIEPKNHLLRLNLAKLLIQAGDKKGARAELDTLAGLGEQFPRQQEVGALLKSL